MTTPSLGETVKSAWYQETNGPLTESYNKKSCLLKQAKPRDNNKSEDNPIQVPNEVFASEALVAVNYKKITQNCKALNEEQKTKLLAVLKQHEPLFQSKHSNW